MAVADSRPVLYLIACGAGPARQLADFAQFARDARWDVCAITTPAGAAFLDTTRMAELTGHPVRVHYKHPDEPDVLPPPDAFAVAPVTFNTINKWAAGISDTLALGLLNEALGLGLPIVAAPWPNSALARHPAFEASVARLRDWGVRVVLDLARLPRTDDPDAAVFLWPELRSALPSLRRYDTP